jgi:hypothetical protein
VDKKEAGNHAHVRKTVPDMEFPRSTVTRSRVSQVNVFMKADIQKQKQSAS